MQFQNTENKIEFIFQHELLNVNLSSIGHVIRKEE